MDVDARDTIPPDEATPAGLTVAGDRRVHGSQETVRSIRRTLARWLQVGVAETREDLHRSRRDRLAAHRRILVLLRRGISYREIAELLHTNEKTIWRLIRRLDPEAHRPCPPS